MAEDTDSQAPAEPTTSQNPPVTETEAPDEPTTDPTATETDSTPDSDGSEPDQEKPDESADEAAPAEQPAQAPAGRTDTTANQQNVVPAPAATATDPKSPLPGKLIKQKTTADLEKELDDGKHASIDDFVKAHFEAGDANVQRMAQVLRMDTVEIYQVLKDLGYKFSEGL